jgi:phenylalanyl-tRNA synthetase beta chain
LRISTEWLAEWVRPDWDTRTLAHRLTMAGFEVEGVEAAAPDFSGVVVARLLECSALPRAEKLSLCLVDGGDGEPVQVVCGAPNARAGMLTAFAKVGAELPGGQKIGKARLRGVESLGMLCSARELGLGESHEGILDLPDSLTVGEDLRDALALDDAVLELSLTPNRGDALSILGIAREVSALSGEPLEGVGMEPVPAAIDGCFDVRLVDSAACPRFAGRVIRGIRPDAKTPLWMIERLRRAGLRSVSPVVDVTNYVMLELGQPMHAYDLRRLDHHIDVRFARSGERLELLDGSDVELHPDVLVIADRSAPVGIAGVMGGEKSGIAEDTTDVFLEAAFFAPAAIAGRARRFGMQTDASQRFERGVDPTLQERAAERATSLLTSMAGGKPGPLIVTESVTDLPPRAVVQVSPASVGRLLGVRIPDAEIESILLRLGMRVEREGPEMRLTAPSYRFDIAIEQDVTEEIARVYGYDAIPAADAPVPQVPGPATELVTPRERASTLLADRSYQEVITYSFVDAAMQRQFEPEAELLELSNPIASDMGAMRRSLWPGLCRVLLDNVRRQQGRVRLFELGARFPVERGLLHERLSLAGLAWGEAYAEQWGLPSRGVDFFDVKGDVEALLGLTGRRHLRFEPAHVHCLHPGRTARITHSSTVLGLLGELHPELCRTLELKSAPVLFELDYAPSFSSELPVFHEVSRFPAIRRDLAVVVSDSVPIDKIRESVLSAAGERLVELRVFDIYRGKGIEPGAKSVALGLILQETSRTLTDTDADVMVAAVVARLKNDHNATIRE